ncbi:hypothetical protein Salat_0670400 [Sesamum alatum]|uniref:Uncharacterized protein n=1 Tax=Sesamum alatum TaxID=300844 RepID=A0AAE1YRU2_9LAMI|nr:hypothetical protein Salat_0670400 [Sesamum alatum]
MRNPVLSQLNHGYCGISVKPLQILDYTTWGMLVPNLPGAIIGKPLLLSDTVLIELLEMRIGVLCTRLLKWNTFLVNILITAQFLSIQRDLLTIILVVFIDRFVLKLSGLSRMIVNKW